VVDALRLGYDGVQMGTRFIATTECTASASYKQAIVAAGEDDIVWSERITGVPVAVIATPWIRRMGLQAGPLARRLLRGRRTKHWMRTLYTLRAALALRRAARQEAGRAARKGSEPGAENGGGTGADPGRAIWQAGRSVEGIRDIRTVAEVLAGIEAALADSPPDGSRG
jgi:nitronate monooxygenase